MVFELKQFFSYSTLSTELQTYIRDLAHDAGNALYDINQQIIMIVDNNVYCVIQTPQFVTNN